METAGLSKILVEQHWMSKTKSERTCSRNAEQCTASQSPQDVRKQWIKDSRKQSPTRGKIGCELFSEDRKQDASCAERSPNQDAMYANKAENKLPAVLREVQTKMPGMLLQEQKTGCQLC
jgi:hypothetical protein